MKLPIHRIIPFSNVEGTGNRTSIFVQGCQIKCLYCHNPETISFNSDKALSFSIDELVTEVKKNVPFIRGITVSGGEPTLYYKYLTDFFSEIKELNLTTYIDTNGFFDFDQISPLIDVTDKFLFDIKGTYEQLTELCFDDIKLPDESTKNFENLNKLLELDKVEEVRLVYIKGYYDEFEVVCRIGELLKNHPEVLFKLIRVHERGADNNYQQVVKERRPSNQDMELLYNHAVSCGINNIKVIR